MPGIIADFDHQAFVADLRTLDADLKRAGKIALRLVSDGLREGHRQAMRDGLERPTPFTEDSLYIVGSPSAIPEIIVGIKDAQAGYLAYAYQGGHRDNAIVPSDAAVLDGYGNMPRGYTRAVAASGGFWMTGSSGIRGLFVDDGRGGIEAVAFKVDAEYEQRLDFGDEIEGLVDELIPSATLKAFDQVFGGSS